MALKKERAGLLSLCDCGKNSMELLQYFLRARWPKVKGSPEGCDLKSAARLLYYFPIIHTQADMGAISESVQRLKISKLGRRGWERNTHLIDQLWTQIEQAIANLNLPYAQVRVYQDGLPHCAQELAIVAELARAGSRNHRLLLQLKDRGATIMGTESAELLVEEYQLAAEAFSCGDLKEVARREARQKAMRDSLLERRDRCIAARINSTLAEGETGILFLGVLHCVTGLLDQDIRVRYPIDQPLNLRRR